MPPKKRTKKKRPGDKPPKKGHKKPPEPPAKPPAPIVSESHRRAVALNTPVARGRLSAGDLVNALVQAAILFNVLNGEEATKAYAQQRLIEQYLALEVPAGKTVELVWEESQYSTELNGTPTQARVPVRGSFSVGRPGDPAGLRSPNAIIVRKTIVGTGPPVERPPSDYVVDALLLAEDAEYAARMMADRARPQISRVDRSPVSAEVLGALNEGIDEYLDKTKRTEGGGGGGPGEPGADPGPDPAAALPAEEAHELDRKLPKPEIIDLPLPETGVGVASAGGRGGAEAEAEGRPDDAGSGAFAAAGGLGPPAPPDAHAEEGDALNRWRRSTWQAHQHVLDFLLYSRPAPPPIPVHPGFGKSLPQRLAFDGLRKLDGRPLKDGSGLWNVHRALVAEVDEKGPLKTAAEDEDGERTWVEMLLTGRFRAPTESVQAGDLVIVGDAAAVDGGYPAVVTDHDKGSPKEILVAHERALSFRLMAYPPTATVLDAWVPRPAYVLSEDSPIGAFWGPEMRRLRALLAIQAGEGATDEHLVGAIAAGLGKRTTDMGALMELVIRETYLAGPATPLYPGSVVFGREGEVGVVMSDGSVLGVTEVGASVDMAEFMRPARFRPTLVWYPAPR